MKDQGGKMWKRKSAKAKRNSVLAVPKGVYKGFKKVRQTATVGRKTRWDDLDR